mmetsp:Transcript_12697/g.36360  ORF Transcript_12697/g.36360 Transcript_12697/m.36360 type:complete len:127 (+) Transcript_12697:596-976(+)
MPGQGTTGSKMGDIMATAGRVTIAGIIGADMAVGTLTITTMRRAGGMGVGMGAVVDTVADTVAGTMSEGTMSKGMMSEDMMGEDMMGEVDMVDTTIIVSSHTRVVRLAGRHRTCGKARGTKRSAQG